MYTGQTQDDHMKGEGMRGTRCTNVRNKKCT